jgi:hypothetical protein
MNNQGDGSQHQLFLNNLLTHGVGLFYFLGSQKELGPARLRGEAVEGKPDSDLDLGVVLLEHPLDYWEGQKLRQHLEDSLAPSLPPCVCIFCYWKKKTPTSSTPPFGVSRFMPSLRILPAVSPPGPDPLWRLALLVAVTDGA